MKSINLDATHRGNPEGRLYKNDLFVYQGNWKEEEDPSRFFRLDVLGICLVERGIHRLTVNSKEYEIVEGDILICRTNDIVSGLYFSDDFQGTFLYAAMDIVSCYMDALTFRRYMEMVAYSPVLHLDGEERALCRVYSELLRKNKTLFDGSNIESMIMIGKAMIIDIFSMLPKTIGYSDESGQLSRPKQIYRDFLNILSSMPKKRREVEYYAALLSVSPKYLSHVCRQESGKTAREWLNDYIMNDAQRYLTGSKLTVKEIAFQLGFTNFAFFCKSVKQHFGLTPLQIRNDCTNRSSYLEAEHAHLLPAP